MLKELKNPLVFLFIKGRKTFFPSERRKSRNIGTEGFYKINKIIFLILFTITALSLTAQSLEYHVQKPKKLFVGTPFHLHIDIQTSLQDSIFAPVIDTLDVFILREMESKDIVLDDSVTTKIDMTFQAFDTGELTFPPLEFTVMRDHEITLLSTNEFILNVESILADSSNVIQDIAAPLRLNFGFWDYFIPIIIIIILVTLIFYINRFIKSRKKGKAEPIIRDERPAWQIVLELLLKLKKENLLEKANFLEFYFRLSYLLRLFIELHFNIHAVEMTTSEIRQNLANIDSHDKSKILKTLSYSDRVKFAKFIPGMQESKEALQWLEDYLLSFREKEFKPENKKAVENDNA